MGLLSWLPFWCKVHFTTFVNYSIQSRLLFRMIKYIYNAILVSIFFQNILLSDSSSDEEESESPNERLQNMIRMRKLQRKCQSEFYGDREVRICLYYQISL